MKHTLKQLWIKACEHDSIEPSSKFVVFSKDNRWAKKYNTLALLISQTPVLHSAPSQRPISY
jgi:hypothetical protein